jgi:HlyD family secretion protein
MRQVARPRHAQLRSVTEREKDGVDDGLEMRAVEPASTARSLLSPGSRKRSLPLRGTMVLGLVGVAAVVALAFWLPPAVSPAIHGARLAGVPTSPNTINAAGRLEPTASVTVGSSTSGVIAEVLCDENMRVKKGQTCVRIDPRAYQADVDQDRASLATANAQLEKDQAALNYELGLVRRYRSLLARNAASQDQVDNVATLEAQARAQVDFDKASIAQRAATLEAAKINLGYTNIVSPIDGTVVARKAMVGETIVAQFQSPTLFVIASDLSKMQLDTKISEKYIDLVRTGDRVTYSLDALPNRNFEGTIRQIQLVPEQQSNAVSYGVSISVDNHEGLFRPGMVALATIHIGGRGAPASVLK